ncbi:MAG: AcvB/VirJ family lysyl-phosphatidylglycerol hydrolase [Chthoniobacterales bacterium]|jgi:type IV secretory pathway VirJ component
MRSIPLLLAKLTMVFVAACSSHKLPSAAEIATVPTSRGEFSVGIFPAAHPARGLVLLASGDGGWTDFEEKISRTLAERGFSVAGWDCRKYADLGTYDRARLLEDANAALAQAAKSVEEKNLPILLVGFSTGAEQVVALASGEDRPASLAGLLVMAPGDRGRYGITLSDLMGLPPTGPDTFALKDLRKGLKGLRIYQIHGEHDPLDQTEWLDGLGVPHQLAVYPDGWHQFKGGPPDFLAMVAAGASWILND